METNSHPEAAASTVKQGQYSPRKRKDTAPKVNPQLAIELFFQEMGRIEAYTKRIEDATSRKVQIDGKSLESAENRLKNVLSDFERQGYRMKNGGYVDKRISFYSILCAVISLLFACFMCYLWTDAAKDRDNYKQYYRQQMDNARTTSNLLRTENQKLKAETKELKKELGKMKDLFNSEQLEALRHHFPNISKAMEEGKDLFKQITRSRGFGMGM